jgi:hypothetical protein
MNNWAILGFDRPILFSRHNIGGEGRNFRLNNLFFDVWCVIWVQVSFNAPTLRCQPFPIMGIGYEWSLNFANPLSLFI